ncbi:2TM domain-containing protein [Flavobacterium sp.]|uniref:2TM domain-containing protein n=1 Tax=Flavobacterium sp. TaxID=239 RepID=UPI003D1106AF
MFIINIFLFLFLSLVEYFLDNEAVLNFKWLYNFVYYAVYGFVIGTLNETYFSLIYNKVKIETIGPKRFIIGFLGSIPIGLLGVFLSRFIIQVLMKGQTISYFFKNQHKADYFFSSLITVVIVLIFHLVYFYRSNQEQKLKEQKVIAGTASAQFESLKNQIDPHFLFNSLNVLTSLIEENPDQAQRFTTSLSKVYRYVLEQKDKELISVEEELAFAKTYMNLLKMRFENSISFELPTDFTNAEAKVVPLSLQLLLENTIKHNVVSEKKPLHIKIYIDNGYLIVENNLQKKEVLQDRKGVGLQNIVNRYALISARKVMVEENSDFFRVLLPILTKQITIMETQNIYNENLAYTKAKERVEQLRGFYGNLISYCCVIPFLIFINLKTSDFLWFWFPTLGWGMGVFFHAFEVFGFVKNWEERKIQEILNKDNEQKNKWN